MAFNVKRHLIRVQGGREYLPVAYRLVWFREDHPDWGIDTKPILLDVDKGVAVFQASVYNAEGRLMASGTKMETARGFADFAEKSETGAIGRALGVLGYGTQFAPEFDEGERVVDSPLPLANGAQRRPRASEPSPAAETATAGFTTCAECGRPLTKGQADYSTVRFGRPLCPSHQTRTPAEAA
ncbi:MAG TPA: hypothetical protein VGM37_16045 [Armatimonadota bacterium]|jgi:hypothetical protein